MFIVPEVSFIEVPTFFLSAWMFMLVVPALVSVFSYLGSYGIGTEISCMF